MRLMTTDEPSETTAPPPARSGGGEPRRIRTSSQTRGHDHPDVVRAVPEDRALPGELRPLVWTPGRAEPITADEALGATIRRFRVDRVAGKKGSDAREPESLSDPAASKVMTSQKLPPLLLELVRARAEMEDTNPTAVTEEAYIRYALGVPQDPDVVRARQRGLLEWFINDFTPGTPPEDTDRVPVAESLPAWLLKHLHEEAARKQVDPAELLTQLVARGLGLI